MRRLFLSVCVLMIWSTAACAASDVVATYVYQDGTMMTLCVRDSEHVRMDTSPTSYTLLKGNKVYSVNKDDDGNWQVMDMAKMAAMSAGMGSMFGGGTPDPADSELTYTKTGKKEKVAGYTGLVYSAEYKENGKVVSRDEAVLSTHSDLKQVNEGWVAFARAMTKAMGHSAAASMDKSLEQAEEYGYGGMLRYGDEMRLKSLKKTSLKASYFSLPAGAQQMQVQQPPQQSQQQSDSTGLGQDAKDVGQAARDEAKDSTIEGVREGVRDVFKSLF
ncbi:hypothetical protein [Desulfovibrio ferrophilus]|uniref:DUF4412 domain-containing protein n=1 Tax=Desulfovibrio ferrophilus TaxID=241368 RepID=A0A2Z6AVX5_9BACT|nr:hypothetical protein [Desulfovibrio ferrophilus]BBD07368.1 uncharacterized protein DFE_0642 [Desulfovibrio ferrophilus]